VGGWQPAIPRAPFGCVTRAGVRGALTAVEGGGIGVTPNMLVVSKAAVDDSRCRAPFGALLQRILPSGYQATYAVLGSRIGTSALRKGALFHTPSV
jgi:hypothetical protein